MPISDLYGDSSWRRLFDPTGIYPAEGLRIVEQRALEVLAALEGRKPDQPSLFEEPVLTGLPPDFGRTRDIIQFDHHYDPDGDELDFISFVISADHLEIRLPVIEWTGGYMGPAVATTAWVRKSFERLSGRALTNFIAAGIAEQRSRFVFCCHCNERIGPGEQLHLAGAEPMCHSCGSTHHGIVF